MRAILLDFQSILQHEKTQVDTELRSIFDTKIQQATHPFLKEYYQMQKEYISPSGGEAKRIRPVLVHQTYEAFHDPNQELIPQEVLYRIACSVELLHNASLIHDDIIDNDAFRRGQPAFHTRYTNQYLQNSNKSKKRAADFGRNMGILGGDHAYFIGLEILLNLPLSPQTCKKLVEIYHHAFDGILEGVVIEEILANAHDISQSDYMFMIQMKTAHLLKNSVAMGLLLAGTSGDTAQKMINFISLLGQAFQIQDDILGTFGDSAHKPTDSDIIEGKKTVLLMYALGAATASQLKVIQKGLGNSQATPEEVEQIREIYRNSDALEKSKKLLTELTGEARAKLKEIQPAMSPSGKEFFTNFVDFIIKRTY